MSVEAPLEVKTARRRICDAIHAMHADQQIIIAEHLAVELEGAWDAYDELIEARTVNAGVRDNP